MVKLSDIRPLTDFLRNHKDHIRRLKKAARPEVLTVNGKAALVVQDVASYQELLDSVERAEVIAGIRAGLDSMHAGQGVPIAEFDRRMRRKYGLLKRS